MCLVHGRSFEQGRSRTKRKKILVLILASAGLLLVLVLVAPAIFNAWILHVPFRPMPFDSEVWRATPSEFSLESKRLRMVDELLSVHLSVGMSRAEVVGLIGEPDTTPYFADFDMVYHLGQERHPFGVDSEWLVIRLDEAGHVSESLVVSD